MVDAHESPRWQDLVDGPDAKGDVKIAREPRPVVDRGREPRDRMQVEITRRGRFTAGIAPKYEDADHVLLDRARPLDEVAEHTAIQVGDVYSEAPV